MERVERSLKASVADQDELYLVFTVMNSCLKNKFGPRFSRYINLEAHKLFLSNDLSQGQDT